MRKRIGDYLIEKGLVTQAQVQQILSYSQETGLRFGIAGMELGIYSREDLVEVFGPSFAVDFFYLDPAYFPQNTRDLLPVEEIVRLGALPLGFKTERRFFRTRKMLNLGLLSPERKDSAEEALRIARTRPGGDDIQGVKVFLVLADHFLQVLNQVYRKSDAELRGRDQAQVDETLLMFLEQHG
jgi:hypothetical protein